MWEIDRPWWEFVARAAIVYAALMVLVRVSGKRSVGQFTPFDLLVVMLLSESVSNALGADSSGLLGGLLSASTLILLNLAMGYISTRTRKAEDLLDGQPVLIARDGELLVDVLRRHRLGQGDWEQALREADAEMEDVRRAFLETDGTISILKRKPPAGDKKAM